MLDFAFRTAGIKRVEAGAMPSNRGSIAVLRKAGFQELGLAPNHVKINGKWEDHLIFAIDAKPGE
ncbi:ribosomal-protein-S5-alanine N-acetyltransferase [compost metagenome]